MTLETPVVAISGTRSIASVTMSFDAVEVFLPKLEGEIIGHLCVAAFPVGFAIRLIGAEIVAAFFLSQVIGDVYIADEGKLFAVFFGPCHHFGDLFCQQILVLHHHHRNGTSAIGLEPLADALGVVASGVDHIVGGDIAFFSVDDPAFVSLAG